MTTDSIISIASAVISLAAAIIIGILQVKQGRRMEQLAIRQDAEAKQRRTEHIILARNKFLAKYLNCKDEIYLLPLCVMAVAYNSTFSYHREMYREYNLLEDDVKYAVCSYMGLDLPLPQVSGDVLISRCIKALGKEERLLASTGSANFFSANAKYFYRGIKQYPREEFPVDCWKIEDEIENSLCAEHTGAEKKKSVAEFMADIGFGGNRGEHPDVMNCEIYALMARWMAKRKHQGVYYKGWIPGEYYYEQIETMEDLFLCSLLCIYVYLLRPNEKGKEHE